MTRRSDFTFRMIQSLFLLSPTGEVLIERHFRGTTTPREAVCNYFWEQASRSIHHHGGVSSVTTSTAQQLYDTVPPVMEVPVAAQGTLYVISCLRDGLSYLAVCPAEVSPLLILEFLHRVAGIFAEYFGGLADEAAVKDNFSTVYQLLEEMVDYGWPLTTEPNALKAMIRPPTVLSKLLPSQTVSDELPKGTISNMPWRAVGVVHQQNEIYVDICEHVDALLDPSGGIVSVDVSGTVQCQCHLSGIPDLVLTFQDPKLIDDCSFHPCVRYARYEQDSVVSFVPPDGDFQLMRYRLTTERIRCLRPPLYCHPQWSVNNTKDRNNSITGRVSIQAGLTTLSSLIFSSSHKGPLEVEDLAIHIPFPNTATPSNFSVTVGSVLYNEAGHVARWTIGKLSSAAVKASLTCSVVQSGNKRTFPQPLSLQWQVPLASVSGLTVSGLSISREAYQPYKGVRNLTRSGVFQVQWKN